MEAAARTLLRYARVTQPLSPRAAPRPVKKKESRERQTKIAGAGLEGFVDWARVVDSEPTEEEEMFSFATGLATRMRKWLMALEGEATSSFEKKLPRRSPSEEGAQEGCAIISVESPDLASHDQPTLGVYLNETDAPLDEGVPAVSPSNVEEV